MPDRPTPPEWSSDRVTDPEGWWLWLAVDAYPDEASALGEAATSPHEIVKVTGRERMKLRWADEDDEDDAYLMDEWGVTQVAEPAEDGDREFWSIQMFRDSVKAEP